MMRPGFFRRDVERALRVVAASAVVGAFAVTLAWGYEQRVQAQQWRELACAHRVAELASRARFLGLDDQPGACERLRALGLGVRATGVSTLPVRDPLVHY